MKLQVVIFMRPSIGNINLNIGTPKKHYFSIGTNGKLMVLGIPILEHIREYSFTEADVLTDFT